VPKKGFSVPMAEWLRGPLRSLLLDLVHSRLLADSPWLQVATVRQMAAEHLAGLVSHEVRLWAVVCFLEWQRQSEEAPASGEPRTAAGRAQLSTRDSVSVPVAGGRSS
jgi:asparagine synthase (glutamine-hydrolysing)